MLIVLDSTIRGFGLSTQEIAMRDFQAFLIKRFIYILVSEYIAKKEALVPVDDDSLGCALGNSEKSVK